METKLRDMLHERAGQAQAPTDIPARTLRRARRRRAGVAAVGSLAVVLVGLAGYLGVRVMGDSAPLPPATETPSVTPTTPTVDPTGWSAIWPRETREQTEAAQACADGGDPDCTWRVEVEEFVGNFAIQALAWDEVGFGDGLDLAEPDSSSMDLLITDCTDLCFGGLLVKISVERLVRQDRTGIWSVTSMGQVRHFTDAICTNCPTTDDEIGMFAEEFLRRRQMEVGAEAYLSPETLELYRAHDGGLVLYPYEVDSYGEGFEVVSVTAVDGTWAVEVRLDMSTIDGDVFSTMAELLTVAEASQERPFGYPELIVVDAELQPPA